MGKYQAGEMQMKYGTMTREVHCVLYYTTDSQDKVSEKHWSLLSRTLIDTK